MTKPGNTCRSNVRQPAGSALCGQASIASLTGASLAEVTVAVRSRPGRRQQSRTSARDLRHALARLGGYRLRPFSRWTGAGLPPVPFRALLRIRTCGVRHGYHWVAIAGRQVYDPALPSAMPRETYERLMRRYRLYVTSWAVVQDPVSAALQDVADNLLATAKRLVPVDTGTLRQSLATTSPRPCRCEPVAGSTVNNRRVTGVRHAASAVRHRRRP